jgi:hypothetical protein
MIFSLASVSRPALGPTQPPVLWVPGVLSPGGKARAGRDSDRGHERLGSIFSSSPKRLNGVWWDCFFYCFENISIYSSSRVIIAIFRKCLVSLNVSHIFK